MKVGTLPSERLRSDRKWAPERLALGEAPSACECRVCGQSIAEHEMSWGWRWKSTSRGHAVCGWYTLNDVDGVSAILGLGDLRFMPAPRARQRAHELFIMECTTDADGAKVWALSAVGIALLRLLRARSRGEAAE